VRHGLQIGSPLDGVDEVVGVFEGGSGGGGLAGAGITTPAAVRSVSILEFQ
jgi:hypothetical protein